MKRAVGVLLLLLPSIAHSAITDAQNAIATQNSTQSPAISFATLPGAGSAVVLFIASWNGSAHRTVSSVADNQTGNSYTRIGNSSNSAGGNFINVEEWVASNINGPSGTFTVTATLSASGDSRVVIAEYTSGALSSIIDISTCGFATSNSLTSTFNTATNQANEMIIGVMTHVAAATTITQDATNLPNLIRENEDNLSGQAINASERYVTASATYAGPWFGISNTALNCHLVATIKEAAGGAVVIFQRPRSPRMMSW